MSIRMGKSLKQKIIDFFVVYTKVEGTEVSTVCQPKPTFFSNEQIERIKHTPGSYQFNGGTKA